MKSKFDELEFFNESLEKEMRNLKFKHSNEIDFSSQYKYLKKGIKQFIEDNYFPGYFKYSLLAFALELAKQPVTSYWNELFEELGIKKEDETKYRNKFFPILWNTLNLLGIDTITSTKGRLLVGTLKMKVESDPNFLKVATDFFVYYYNNHPNEDINLVLKEYPGYIQYKNKDKDEQFLIIATQLRTVVDHIIKKYLKFLDNDQILNSRIFSDLGINIKKYTRKRISTIVKNVLNRYTPRGFIEILKNNYNERVIIPNGKEYNARHLMTKHLGYGVYKILGKEYHVTPNIKFSLVEIMRWDYNKILNFDSIDFYKKNNDFSFSKGDMRNFNHDGKNFYLWHCYVPIGEKYEVDGEFRVKKGFFWNPAIKLKWPTKEISASVILEISKVNCYFKKYANDFIKIKLNETILKYKIDSDGFFAKRNIQIEIDNKPGKFSLEVLIGDTLIKNYDFVLDGNLLFSANSRMLIKGSDESSLIKRRFGEDQYYLFTTSENKLIETGSDIIIKENGESGYYNVYNVYWKSNDNFLLKVGEQEWKFERKNFLEWVFNYKQNIFSSFKEIKLIGTTNINFSQIDEGLRFRILNKDHVALMETIEIDKDSISESFEIKGTHLLKDLNGDLVPGEYILESNIENIFHEKTFFIIPELDFEWPNILLENEKSFIKFKTLDGSKIFFKDTKTGLANTIHKKLEGNINYINLKNNVWDVNVEMPKVKLAFLISRNNNRDEDSFLIKEYEPKEIIPVFGYRIYSKDTGELISINEINYYKLMNSSIMIFTKPFENTELIDKYNRVLIKKQADDKGICCFDELNIIKNHCKSSETKIRIRSASLSKDLTIVWHPRIHEINSLNWSNDTLHLKLNYEGPLDGLIKIKLHDINTIITEKFIKCNNRFEKIDICFSLENNSNDNFIYLSTYISSFNSELLRSKSLTIYNERKLKVCLNADGEKKEVYLNSFEKKIIEVAAYSLYQAKIFKLEIPKTSLQNDFIEILSIFNSNVEILIPDPQLKDEYHVLKEITGNDSCIHVLDGQNSLDKIINPINPDTIVSHGIAISSTIHYSEFQQNIPKPNPLVVIEGQKLDQSSREFIVNNSKVRNLIFIQKKIKMSKK